MISCDHETGQCEIRGLGIDLLAEYAIISDQLTGAMSESSNGSEEYVVNTVASALMSAMHQDKTGCFRKAIEKAYECRDEEVNEDPGAFARWKAKLASAALRDALNRMEEEYGDDEPKEPIDIRELLEKAAKEREDKERVKVE